MIINFGEYLPDSPNFNNPGLVQAKNSVPAANTYQSFPSQVIYSNALNARCQGAFSTKDRDGNTVNFAGDATKLYKSASAVYADVSLAGGYSTNSDESWQFCRFANKVIATNFNNNPQYFDLTSSTNFANLTTALQARYCTAIRSFLVLGNTNDGSDGEIPHRVRWSALGDPTNFTVSAVTQSDFQDLDATNGWIRAVVGGEYGTIFQERAISRMTYIGSPAVFQFDTVELGRGTQAPNSVVKVGNLVYYLGADGFYVFDGNTSMPIGENKINQTFFADLDLSYQTRIFGVADFNKQVIYWAYPGNGNTSGRSNKILCYNYSPNSTVRWTFCDGLDIEFLYASMSEGFTLDTIDSFGTLETLPYSLDSRVWTGHNLLLSGFDSSHKQINFTGTALNALFETGEYQPFPGQLTNLYRIRPLVDGTSVTPTLQIGYRNNLTDSVNWTMNISTDQIGEFQTRINARYIRARLNLNGNFNNAQGLEVIELSKAGNR